MHTSCLQFWGYSLFINTLLLIRNSLQTYSLTQPTFSLMEHIKFVFNFTQRYSLLKKCKMVSVFTWPDVNMREVGRTRDKRRKPRRKAETILHFFYKITNERGTKTVFTCTRVKWFYGQLELIYCLNYFIISFIDKKFRVHLQRKIGATINPCF